MNIFVCIKQVPGTNKVDIDPVTGTLKRGGVDSKMNPYDLYALETALRLRERCGGKVSVVSMGPPQAETVIREAYAMGADEGVLLSDRRFGGADVLATSYALSQGVRRLGEFDLLLCGKQTTDGDTAQVGPELAEWLGIPSVSNVRKIDPQVLVGGLPRGRQDRRLALAIHHLAGGLDEHPADRSSPSRAAPVPSARRRGSGNAGGSARPAGRPPRRKSGAPAAATAP